MAIEYIIYIPIVVLVSIILFSKAKEKVVFGIFLIWLFASPILLNPRYTLNFFGIDIQPNRFLFLVLAPLLYMSIMTPRRSLTRGGSIKATKLRLYEKFMIGYVLIVLFAFTLNIDSIGIKGVMGYATNIIAFIMVYFSAKRFINDNDLVLFQYAILTFAAMSSIVAVYQFFVNPEFFRLGVVRSAFSGYYRSNGLFTAEYDQGLFLNLSIIVAMSMKLRSWIKILLISILCAGIFLTMHRLSWVAMIMVLGLIWFFYLRKNLLTNILVPSILIIIIIVALYVPWAQIPIGGFGSRLIMDRISSDTLTERFSQYEFSFYMIKNYPLGIGEYSSSNVYNQEALNRGIPYADVSSTGIKYALIVHNGFLSAAVQYGILGLIFFSLFIFTSVFDFLKNSFQKGRSWYPLLMIIITFMIYNLTNDFSFLGSEISVALAWLIGGYISVNNPNDVSDINLQSTI